MEKTLAEIAVARNFSPLHINKLLHHVASTQRRSWTHVRNVFTGRSNSGPMTACLLEAMDLPEDELQGYVANKSGSPAFMRTTTKTPCRCVTCGKLYTRYIFWTGTLPARLRCNVCKKRFGFNDTWGDDA